MKTTAWLLALLVVTLPTAAAADDLMVTMYYSPDDVECSWTAHDVESGIVPTVICDLDADRGITLATELEFTEDGNVRMAFEIAEVTSRERRDGTSVLKKRVVSTPALVVQPESPAFIKSGNPSGYLEVEAVYIPTDDEELEE